MNVYLEPFVEECRSLWSDGVQWVDPVSGNDRLSKIYTTCAVCDSVARPLMQNMMQFNGYQGCGFCKNPGVTVSKGRGFVRVYPYRRESTLRNYIETVECAEQALDSQQPICGVKGPSVLYNIPKFDIVENFVPDYMHCLLLGVCAVAVNAASDVEPSDTESDERQHVSSDILKITESSLEQNQLLLFALKAKHQLTSEALADIMKVINVICDENVVATSKYLFEKQISDVKEVVRVCYICKNCGSNLDSSVTSGICSVCDEVWTSKDCIEKGNFSFTFH
ncbi:UNVERIFIED_CONTAM: hypothetical protein FKN15_053066 [Acipenser sinensis]